jgi:hypothetical protein
MRLVEATLIIRVSIENPCGNDVVGCEQSGFGIVAAWVFGGAGSYELFHLYRIDLRIGEMRLLVYCNRFDSGNAVWR